MDPAIFGVRVGGAIGAWQALTFCESNSGQIAWEAVVIGTNFPVEGIELLATRVRHEHSELQARLTSLRTSCQRDENFTGTAADAYDNFLYHWDASQKQLLESLDGAATILMRLAELVRESDQAVARSFL